MKTILNIYSKDKLYKCVLDENKISIGSNKKNKVCINSVEFAKFQIEVINKNDEIIVEDKSGTGLVVSGERFKSRRIEVGETCILNKIHNIVSMLVQLNQDEYEEVINLNSIISLTIGKSSKNDVIIYDNYLSTKHCKIVNLQNSKFRIYDLDSTNGVYINGNKVKEFDLCNFDIINIGKNQMILMDGLLKICKSNDRMSIKRNENEDLKDRENTLELGKVDEYVKKKVREEFKTYKHEFQKEIERKYEKTFELKLNSLKEEFENKLNRFRKDVERSNKEFLEKTFYAINTRLNEQIEIITKMIYENISTRMETKLSEMIDESQEKLLNEFEKTSISILEKEKTNKGENKKDNFRNKLEKIQKFKRKKNKANNKSNENINKDIVLEGLNEKSNENNEKSNENNEKSIDTINGIGEYNFFDKSSQQSISIEIEDNMLRNNIDYNQDEINQHEKTFDTDIENEMGKYNKTISTDYNQDIINKINQHEKSVDTGIENEMSKYNKTISTDYNQYIINKINQHEKSVDTCIENEMSKYNKTISTDYNQDIINKINQHEKTVDTGIKKEMSKYIETVNTSIQDEIEYEKTAKTEFNLINDENK